MCGPNNERKRRYKHVYSFKATLFEVFEVLFGKPRKRGNIFGDKTKVSFG